MQEVTGIIISGLNRIHVTIQPELLILDVESYIKDLLVTQEDALTKIASESDEKFAGTVCLLRRCTGELREWLDTRKSAITSIPPLKRRMQMKNYKVHRSNVCNYARVLLAVTLLADDTDIPMFVFYANLWKPTLYVVRELRFIAAHTGSQVLGIVESEMELARRVELATTDWSQRR